MSFTLTWSFGTGFEDWTFSDESFGGTSSASREHVAGAIKTTMFIPANPPNDRQALGFHISPPINATITNGDTIEFDFGAVTGDQTVSTFILEVTYADTTTESQQWSSVSGAGTRTFTLTQDKTLDFFNIRFSISAGGIPTSARTAFRDLLEVRLITAIEVVAEAGKLTVPSNFSGALAGGGAANIASKSADGLFVYIAAFDSLGFTALIKISTALLTDGSIVFNPAGGDRIGVQCGRLNANVVWIAGSFNLTNTVEKSEDAGGSFSIKDNATMGSIRAFTIGPDNDERVIVFDETNGDILETIDDGATWTTINASVTPEVNAIARLDNNIEETVFGNDGGATDSIDYSVNSGANLQDFQTGVFPNVDVTGVIVN